MACITPAWSSLELSLKCDCLNRKHNCDDHTFISKYFYADNASFQREKQFHEACRKEVNPSIYLLPENHTDKVQPVDVGLENFSKPKWERQWRSGLNRMKTLISGMTKLC